MYTFCLTQILEDQNNATIDFQLRTLIDYPAHLNSILIFPVLNFIKIQN